MSKFVLLLSILAGTAAVGQEQDTLPALTDDPAYKLTTDWGAVDGYHAPSRVLLQPVHGRDIRLSPTDFRDVEGDSLPIWDDVKELRLGAKETLRAKGRGARKSRVLGATWQGPEPEFRNLRWISGAKINQ